MASPTVAERSSAPARSPRPAPATAPAPARSSTPRSTEADGPRVRLGAAPPTEEVSLKGSATFAPPQPVADHLATHPRGGGEVAVRFPGLAAGVIRVREQRGKYSTPGDLQAIDIQHPLLEPLRSVNLNPLLAVVIRDSTVTGFLTVSAGKRPASDHRAIADRIRANASTLGLLGMGDLRLPKVDNKLEGGALLLKTDLGFKLGGFLTGTGSLGLTDDVVTFAAHAEARVKGAATLAIDLQRRPDGVIAGRSEGAIDIKNFSGNFVVTFAGGIVDVTATARYRTEKLSGELTLLITDAQTARTVAYEHLPPEAIDASAREAAGGSKVAAAPSAAGPKPGPRAVAGWGELNVHYNEWLTGRALVIVDGKGDVTVVGKITPPGKVEFPQTKVDIDRKIFGFEVRAGYGIPVVGEVGLFAGVYLFAIAKVSPLTISKIEIGGTYSTDPEIFNSFSLSANLNLSALAGLRVRAEGGIVIEILDHDIKIGAALTATAGIRGYVDATPVIGYRELADPLAGRKGEFYIHGEAELAAQPFLAFAGELFVKLVTPWWSPLSDDRWTWPLGELVYPLPGEIGIGADVDYVFGSGKLPTVSPRKVDFNADKFMTDLMDDKVAHGSAAELKKPGKWNERQQPAPAPPAPQLKDSKGPGKKQDRKAAKDAGRNWAEGMKAVAALKKQGETKPFTPVEIEAALKPIKAKYGFSILQAKPVGEQWQIDATLGKDTLKKPIRIKRAPGPPAVPGAGAPAPAMPEKTFTGGGEKHRIFIVVQGTRAIPMIQSDAQRIADFIEAVAGGRANVRRDEAMNNAYVAAEKVDKLANEVEALALRGKPIADKRKELGDAENELALHIQTALDRTNINTLDRGYLLEGVVGTYGAMPKQSGDRLTPDHQPQDSLMKKASKIRHPDTGAGLFTGTRFARYDTDDGWAINLRHERHTKGLTYGRPPEEATVNKVRDAARGKPDIVKARKAAIEVLRAVAKLDANKLDAVVKEDDTHPAWADIRRKLPGDRNKAERDALKARIEARVVAGEKRIRQQPLEEFLES